MVRGRATPRPIGDDTRAAGNQKEREPEMKSKVLFFAAFLLTLGLVMNPTAAQDRAYVTNMSESTLSVVDLSTQSVIAVVPVGDFPQGVAINPAGTVVCAANTFSDSATVIDAETNTVLATLPVGAFPVGVTAHPDGTRFYVANIGGTISVIDRASLTVTAEVFSGNGAIGVVMSPDGSRLYVSNFGGSFSVFDTTTDTLLDSFPLSITSPVAIAVHPDGTRVYVADRFGSAVAVIDTTLNAEVATMSVGADSIGLAVSPSGDLLYKGDFGPGGAPSNLVYVIDTNTLAVVDSIEVGLAPVAIDFHPDGGSIYVTNIESNDMSVIDAETHVVTATFGVGIWPNSFGEFIGPGIPRELMEDALGRLQALENVIGDGAARKKIRAAISQGKASLKKGLWKTAGPGQVDPLRLDSETGDEVFDLACEMIDEIIDAIRDGEIESGEVRKELLAIAEEVVRAGRVLAAVAIDDGIVGGASSGTLAAAQARLVEGDTLAEAAAAEEDLKAKSDLYCSALKDGYRASWKLIME